MGRIGSLVYCDREVNLLKRTELEYLARDRDGCTNELVVALHDCGAEVDVAIVGILPLPAARPSPRRQSQRAFDTSLPLTWIFAEAHVVLFDRHLEIGVANVANGRDGIPEDPIAVDLPCERRWLHCRNPRNVKLTRLP